MQVVERNYKQWASLKLGGNVMIKNNFLIKGLAKKDYLYLTQLSDTELAEQGIIKQTVKGLPGFPCRVSLADGAVGDTAFLLNIQYNDAHSPYAGTGPVYVIPEKDEARLEINEVPDVIFSRMISLRCYDQKDLMIDAFIKEPRTITAEMIQQILENGEIVYIDVHNAIRGCYSARVNRI